VRASPLHVHEAVVDLWERYMEGDTGQDLKLQCIKDQEVLGTVMVHSALLSSASLVVKAMLSGPMKEGAMSSVNVECRVDAMKLLVSLLYTGCAATESRCQWSSCWDAWILRIDGTCSMLC